MLAPAPEGHDQSRGVISCRIVVGDRQRASLQDPVGSPRVATASAVTGEHGVLDVSTRDSKQLRLGDRVICLNDERGSDSAHSMILPLASDTNRTQCPQPP